MVVKIFIQMMNWYQYDEFEWIIFKLEKQMQLANTDFLNLTTNFSNIQKHQNRQFEDSNIIAENLSFCRQDRKCMEETIQKFDQQSTCRFQQLTQNENQNIFQDITTHNVVDILSSQSYRCMSLMKGYSKRKNFGDVHDRLKYKLLEKYSLYQISKPQKQIKKVKKERHHVVIYKTKTIKRKEIKQQCVKKLYKVLKRRAKLGDCRRTVVQKMEKLGCYEENKKNFRYFYKPLLGLVDQEQELGKEESQIDIPL